MSQGTDDPTQEQRMFWQEFAQLKTDICYVREYRNRYNKWVTSVAATRAIASAGSIAAWAVWHRYAYLWASLVAASQLVDALRNVFPVYKRRAALSAWLRSLNRLFVDSQRIWDEIAAGHLTRTQILKQLHTLRTRQQRAEAKYIPNGLKKRQDLLNSAQTESRDFFSKRYNVTEA